jgi:hypothetical protein
MIKSKIKYKTMGVGSICNNIGKYNTMQAGSICNNIRKYKMLSFGSAAFKWNARKNDKSCRGKYKCSVLEVHIPHKSAKNIVKSSKGKYKSMRAKSTCIHNGKYICSLLEVQKSSIICKTNNGIICEKWKEVQQWQIGSVRSQLRKYTC